MSVKPGAAGGQQTALTLSLSALYGETAESLSLVTQNGSVQITSGAMPEDLDGSGSVEYGDLLRLIAAWRGQRPVSEGDVNQDGLVDYQDAIRIAAAWKRSGNSSTPVPTSTPGVGVTSTFTPTPSSTYTPVPTATSGTPPVGEQEPNDTEQTAQSLGDMTVGRTVRVSGRANSGGMQGEQYTGDLDHFAFHVPQQADIALSFDWTGEADLDLAVGIQGAVLVSATGTEKPIQFQGTLSEGDFVILTASKNQAADYQFTLSASTSTASYANDNSILNGKYQGETTTVGFQVWYNFDGAGNYQYWNWSFVSGDMLIHSGTYRVWYPYLILEHQGEEKVEAIEMEWTSSGVYLDGRWFGKV